MDRGAEDSAADIGSLTEASYPLPAENPGEHDCNVNDEKGYPKPMIGGWVIGGPKVNVEFGCAHNDDDAKPINLVSRHERPLLSEIMLGGLRILQGDDRGGPDSTRDVVLPGA